MTADSAPPTLRELREASEEVEWVWWLRHEVIMVEAGRRTRCLAYYTPTPTGRVDVALLAFKNPRELYEILTEELLHHLGLDDPEAANLARTMAKKPGVRKIIRAALRRQGFRL